MHLIELSQICNCNQVKKIKITEQLTKQPQALLNLFDLRGHLLKLSWRIRIIISIMIRFPLFSVSGMMSFYNIIQQSSCWTWNCAVCLSLLGSTCAPATENLSGWALSATCHFWGVPSATGNQLSKYSTRPRIDY